MTADPAARDEWEAAIDRALAGITVSPTARGVFVGYYSRAGTWRVGMVHRIGDRWQLGDTIGRDAAADDIVGRIRVLETW